MKLPTLAAFSRRTLCATLALLATPPPPPASADVPSDGRLLSSLPLKSRIRGLFESAARPKVRALPRRRLEQPFAVLLMRASYNVADQLDFMPMDEFQKEQFNFRQEEWDAYRQQLSVQQGDLTDPAYFDFISFVQYATLAQGMRNGRSVFEELVDAEGSSAIVRRDPSLPQSNELLPSAHAERVGERILAWMDENFQNLAPRLPPPGRPLTARVLFDGIKQISNIFEINEFALTSSVEPLGDSGIRWTLVAPATLWSGQVLRLRGDLPNDFEVMAATAYLRRAGVPARAETRYENGGTTVVHEFTWPAGFVQPAQPL